MFNMKRYAVALTIPASAVPSLVMARGHSIEEVPEIPLVVNDSAKGIVETASAIKDSQAIRSGKGI